MKNLFSFLLLAIVLLSAANASAASNRIDCTHVIEGDDVGGKFETKASFDSAVPSFLGVVKISLTGSTPTETKTTYLSKDSVCGLKIDFAKDCKATQRVDAKFGYEFSFTCGTDVTHGEIYCDENCLAASGSSATFRCEGPNVAKKLSGAGLSYQGCKFTAAK